MMTSRERRATTAGWTALPAWIALTLACALAAPSAYAQTTEQVATAAIAAKATEKRLTKLSSFAVPRRTPNGDGYFQDFASGRSVYWSSSTGAHLVMGAIRTKYSALGLERSVLGFPTTDETPTADGIGRYNHFKGGSIYWSPCEGAFEIRGMIRGRWAELGWETSQLGYPISDEHDATVAGIGTVRQSRFQGGILRYHGSRGVWLLNERGVNGLTYNVQFLPPPASWTAAAPSTTERAEEIGRAIADYDIVAVQEGFDGSLLEPMIAAAQRHAARCPGPRRTFSGEPFDIGYGPESGLGTDGTAIPVALASLPETLFNLIVLGVTGTTPSNGDLQALDDSGLLLLSRFPILATRRLDFAQSSVGHLDALSAKGVLYGLLWRGADTMVDDVIHVFVTHFDAYDTAAKRAQMRETARFIREMTATLPDAPVMVMGDFNVDGQLSERTDQRSLYNELVTELTRERADLIDWYATMHGQSDGITHTGDDARYDYVFGTSWSLPLMQRDTDVEEFPTTTEHGTDEGFLSDHFGVGWSALWRHVPVSRAMLEASKNGYDLGVDIRRVLALSTDACGEMGVMGNVNVTRATALVQAAPRVFVGNDVDPNIGFFGITHTSATDVIVTVTLTDDDAGLCGGADDPIDVTPVAGVSAASLRVDLRTGAVFLRDARGTDLRQVSVANRPFALTGNGESGSERATMVLTITLQPNL